jgi:hypothetical protein
MPRKPSTKSSADKQEKPNRSKPTRRSSTKRTTVQDQQGGTDISQPMDYERAFDHAHQERHEVF